MPVIIATLGEILVEFIRERTGIGLSTPDTFRGPFASGAPTIFIYAVARLGAKAKYLAVCGDDAFGRLNLERLQEAGVDIQQVRVVRERTTGMAFVAYRQDGSRDFLFHGAQSAAALLSPEDVPENWVEDASWLHITGSSLALSPSARASCYRAVALAKQRKVTVSFDPNLRPELLGEAHVQEVCQPVLGACQILMPSGEEAAMLTGIRDLDRACRALLELGPQLVVLKLGRKGSKVFTRELEEEVASIDVQEVDPTGAGDCFAAGFAVAFLEGKSPIDCARLANVVGALSVRKLGPLEGVPARAEVEQHLLG